ncbi:MULTISPECIES: MazG nucleotide pyrophosphohydrolase domain-containing protein [Glycomyces]|uniref:NTP pyrophosphatase (Non-canonical NTP hydrolase) n=2 Tax=Glycomyces TaxID=58113 RepID=A0A9X3PHI1_9ACTN|nr:MazG nucleotide pyrophosphohydrolase domain-containing protein [Glycomyces lechevalierae]MDA1383741.1 hypothetical protein [Glycomyces lechevalierae]MDR7341268.1 NTP pyrophosphatase (non-canonical NTP hydrolase) [Glycomyces lechevalierae]
MDITEATAQANRLADLFDQLNEADGQRPWSGLDIALGFVGDVGDLMRQVQVAEGIRSYPGGRAALEHELADCLWSVLMLADRYGVDLESAFANTMAQMETRIVARIAAKTEAA